MTRLKLTDITDEKSVRLTLELSTRLHRQLIEYGVALNGGVKQGAPEPPALIGPMLERFMASDREFAKTRRQSALRPK